MLLTLALIISKVISNTLPISKNNTSQSLALDRVLEIWVLGFESTTLKNLIKNEERPGSTCFTPIFGR